MVSCWFLVLVQFTSVHKLYGFHSMPFRTAFHCCWFLQNFTCCFSVGMYHTCGQSCCVELVCHLHGTFKWVVAEWKNHEVGEGTISGANDMNVASGCPPPDQTLGEVILHMIPKAPMHCVGHLRQWTTAHEQPWHSGSDSSGDCDVDSHLPV